MPRPRPTAMRPPTPSLTRRGGRHDPPAPEADLGARAERLLTTGNLDSYRALLADAGQLADPHRRYHAQLIVLRQGAAFAAAAAPADPTTTPAWGKLGRLSGISPNPPDDVLTAVAEAAVEILEATPSEPLMLECASGVFAALGRADAAQALAQAAHRLDPSLLGGAPAHSPAPEPTDALDNLARRAINAADRARPATGLTLSLCMIVRDEAAMLPRCLAAIAPVVDEIVIVDTGSRDATIEIARSFGATVIEHAWTDSFADARNVSFAAATGDWLMYLDADQVLVGEDADELRALTGHTWREAFYLVETSHLGEAGDGFAATDNVLRIFRNRPAYRFTGRVHEQITHTLPMSVPGRIHQTGVRIDHYGYLQSVRGTKAKSERNIALLRKQAAEGEADAFLHFNLGAEYAADGETAAALAEFERAWSLIVAEGPGVDYRYAPPLVARLVEALRQSGRFADAAARAAEGLCRYPEFTDLVFAQARIALETGALDDARGLYRRCIELGDAPARYRPIVGSGTYLPRVALSQLALGDGDEDAARELLGWCLTHHPAFHAPVAPYLTLLLRGGLEPTAAVADVEGRLGTVTPQLRVTLAETLLQAGAHAAAGAQAAALEHCPLPVRERRELLATMYLRQGYIAAAAQEWMAVCAEAPDAAAMLGLARVAMASHQPQDAAVFAGGALELDPDNADAAAILARVGAAALA